MLADPGIVRNRLKVEAFISNARAYLDVLESGRSFDDYLWQFTNGKVIRNRFRTLAEFPVSTPHSDAMSKDLKKRGSSSSARRSAMRSCRRPVASTITNAGVG